MLLAVMIVIKLSLLPFHLAIWISGYYDDDKYDDDEDFDLIQVDGIDLGDYRNTELVT